jgi:hypothetical protein
MGELSIDRLCHHLFHPILTSLQTLTRAELIRQTAEAIAQSISSGIVQPQEIAVLGPGLDTISVTLSTIFQYRASRLSHGWQFWFDGGSVR